MRRVLPILVALTLCHAAAARADPVLFTAVLTGPAEAPPNASPGLGFSLLAYDPTLQSLRVLAGFTGLLAPTTVAHIHCCTTPPGTAPPATPVPSFPGFPTGVTSGFYDRLFDLSDASSFSPAFLSASGGSAEAAAMALVQGLTLGQAYFNIHTTAFPGGEIRGFYAPVSAPAPIPEPATLLLVGTMAGGVALSRRRRARRP